MDILITELDPVLIHSGLDAIDSILSEDYLAHSRTKGSKNGIRLYQNKDGTWTELGKARRRKGDGRKSKELVSGNADKKTLAKKVAEMQQKNYKENNNKSDKSQFSLWLASVGIDAAMALGNPMYAAYLAMDVYRGGKAFASVQKKKKFDKEREGEEIDKETGLHLKKAEMSEKDDLARVNPLVYNFDKATKNNCMLCTVTYDMRRRGYDVEAGIARYGYLRDDIKKWYPDANVVNLGETASNTRTSYKRMTESEISTVKDSIIKSSGEGSRGNLMVSWAGGRGGHSMAYEIKGGKLVIMDGQVNKIYDNPDKILKKCSYNVSFARLDNVAFDPETIKEASK